MGVVALALATALPASSAEREVRPTATLLAAGDIASCGSDGDEATAAILARTPGTIAALGDLAYDSGTAAELHDCYQPSWGRFLARTRAALGNHEYGTGNARSAINCRSSDWASGEQTRSLAHRRAQLELRAGRRVRWRIPTGALARA